MIKLKIGKKYKHVIDGTEKTILDITKNEYRTLIVCTDGSSMSAEALREFYKPVVNHD